jgi:hypothetical protein
MKKFLLMFAAVAAIAFVGCKTETAQPADEQAPAEEQVTPAEPTVETVTADLMKLVEAKDEAGTVNFLDGLKKTAEDFLTAGDNNKYFNIINIIKTVWETNKDKILAALPALKDKILLIYIGQFIRSVGTMVTGGYMWALIPEVISYSEYTSGRRIAGIVNALTGIFFKAGMALGGVIPGLVLSIVGFDQTNEVSQSAFAQQGILSETYVVKVSNKGARLIA